ncbi:prepilin-type N-terminal cleavage/methylation domain-containing protein [Alkalibaculum sp. M08DMB]|uniref:Prepilin-type N-terminal cleavage/methylation domain-containing protein n=1 Tax=Alkalibaculum sporogenes TaxID=2655001 RepID=A0A6A7K6W2_9FIRM|nr:type II secretion system protein [Alkalibaculum sporogenes]MPW25125.1 prepilin-type N-terminal cleavage/methylation domain-containing protein [Alkalibaculum sporogenes]
MNKHRAFTLLEVVVSVFIFSILSISMFISLKFALDAHSISVERYRLVQNGQGTLENVIDEMKSYDDISEITPEIIWDISTKYKDDSGDYYVSITQISHDNLYIIKIIYKESRYESLCTQIYIN